MVQQEDGGLWTHGTVVDKGNHNHYNRYYKIQVTKTGRIITCNRQHIRPTPITAENFLHNQANKHTRRDLLDAILDHIQRQPLPPTTEIISNERPKNKVMSDAHKETNGIQDIKGKQRGRHQHNIGNKHRNNGEIILRTRCGRIVKKPDRLMYEQ